MGQELFLTLILSVCSETNGLNMSVTYHANQRLECMQKLSSCGKNGQLYLPLDLFLNKCYKEIKR